MPPGIHASVLLMVRYVDAEDLHARHFQEAACEKSRSWDIVEASLDTGAGMRTRITSGRIRVQLSSMEAP